MPSERSKAIWERSIPLSTFVTRKAEQRLTHSPLISTGFGWRLLELASRAGEAFLMPGNAIEQTRKAVRRGALIATGFRIAPSKSDAPVTIAVATFANSRIQLLQNTLSGSGVIYGGVRLIPKADIPRAFRSQRPNQAARQSAITAVVRDLSKAGLLPALRKQQVPVVRAALVQTGVGNTGADKTLERQIRLALKLENRK